MERRTFLALAAALLTTPIAEAQPPKVYRVSVLMQTEAPLPNSRPGSFRTRMTELGYIEGQNVIYDFNWADGHNDRFPGLAAAIVTGRPDVIVADSTPAALAAMRATSVIAIPVVMVNVSDPIGSGLVRSLAHPGGNVTGVTDFGTELAIKQVEILHTVLPKVTHIGVLMSDNPVHAVQLQEIGKAAATLDLTVFPVKVTAADQFGNAFASMGKRHVGGFIELGGAPFSTETQRDKIIGLAAQTRLVALYPSAWHVQAGGLLSYGPPGGYTWRTAAAYVDKLLKGAKPTELPVQQPAQFHLAINLKTAKALGLTIPPSLLQRADQVIE